MGCGLYSFFVRGRTNTKMCICVHVQKCTNMLASLEMCKITVLGSGWGFGEPSQLLQVSRQGHTCSSDGRARAGQILDVDFKLFLGF